jgi:Holliday junction resolvase RusA-like endonuclease
MVTVSLPFPISQNRIWRRSGNRIHISKEYADWKAQADGMFLQQRKDCGDPIDGHFTYHFVFAEQERKGRRDGDNLQKCVLDWCQRAGLIKDDKYCDGGSWSWGPVDGVFVRLYKVMVA